MNSANYRAIQAEDNPHLARIITSILEDIDVPKKGTGFADASIWDMYAAFTKARTFYFVLEQNKKVMGGSGIAPLIGAEEEVCELQKMYLEPTAQGKGYGKKLLEYCLDKAREFGYKICYLETMSLMKTAQQFYLKNGFTYVSERMGNTGHFACPVWMCKNL
ncbi:MAG: GNAT family N-acetyltransferase [Bacteroidia bacterium]|nr:GNAT family N-acetyltransferase [Bacteroidia bacterium]